MTEPLVSTLIPVYNAGEYLRASVQSILSQTYSNLEIIIINDGSTDDCMGSIADLKDPRMRIISQENRGKAIALNSALKELSGEFYAIQDSDDISYPTRIERQVQCMLENSDLAAVFTGYDIILDERRLAPRFAGKDIQECRMDIEQMHMPAHDPTGMFRMSMVAEMRYEPTLKVGQGFDYILRVGERYPMMVLGECLYSYRIHPRSVTRQNAVKKEDMIRKVLRRACERRGLDPAEHISSDSQPGADSLRKTQETGIVTHFMESVLDLRRAGKTWLSLKTALACIQRYPYDPVYYKPLAYSLAPLVLIRYYRYRKVKNMTLTYLLHPDNP